jgi:hypothetical protein
LVNKNISRYGLFSPFSEKTGTFVPGTFVPGNFANFQRQSWGALTLIFVSELTNGASQGPHKLL